MSNVSSYVEQIREQMLDGDERDVVIGGSINTLLRKFHKLKDSISRDEHFDLINDLIAFAYTTYDNWDETKSKYNTYLTTCLLHFQDHFVTRYTGIKTTRYQFRKHKEQTGKPLVITLCELPIEED